MGAKINIVAIKLAMVDKCMNVPELAAVAGIRQGTLSKIFQGSSSPRPATIGKIVKALGVDVTEIVSFD